MSQKLNLLSFIVGKPGGGKTSSFRNLGAETVLYHTEKKRLPFKSKGINEKGIESFDDLLKKLKAFEGQKHPQIRVIGLDSFSGVTDMLLAECKQKYKGFDVFNYYNTGLYNLFQAVKKIENQYVFFVSHPEFIINAQGDTIIGTKVKGKEWEGVVEKEATCVFYANPVPKGDGKGVDYKFLTNTPDGVIPAKTPMGMFNELYIDNDIAAIVKVYDEFYGYAPVPANGKPVQEKAAA